MVAIIKRFKCIHISSAFYYSYTQKLIIKALSYSILTVVTLFLASAPIQANVVFSEDFSRSFEKWEPTRDDGRYWSIQDGKAVAEVPTAFTITELIPKDEYWSNEWKNIRYTLEFTPLAGVDKNISFHFQNLSNWYELHFTSKGVELVRVQNGMVPWVVHQGASITNGNMHAISITLNEASISLAINGHHFFTEVDPTFFGNYGKIGIKAGTGSVSPTKIAIDNITVETLSTLSLPVPLVKQTDPKWTELEYDSATAWSPPEPSTIGRWGCALTSMTMLFHYYGLVSFPDGTPITPASFNNWLLTQPDCYLSQGNFNWLAATRLSKEISSHFGTPKLEFRRVTEDIFTALSQELAASKPSIVHIPNHFVVATGKIPEENNPPNFFINDPGYEKSILSEHEQPLSLRTFTPSFTDLSYLLFVPKNNGLSLQLTYQDHEVELTKETERYGSLNSTIIKPLTTTYEYPKPESGMYTLFITGQPFEDYAVTTYIYLDDGTVHIKELTGILGPNGSTITINYNKNTAPTIDTMVSLSAISAQLATLYEEKYVTSPFVRYELQRVITLATKHPEKQSELLTYLVELVTKHTDTITTSAQKYLIMLLQNHQ